MPDPEPARFPSAYRIDEWAPGRVVRFTRTASIALVLAPPFVLGGVLAGPLYFLLNRHSGEPLLSLVVTSGALALGGIIVGVVALVPLYEGLPRRIVFDWPAGTLTITGWREQRTIPLAKLSAVELKCLANGGQPKRGRYDYYLCELHVHSNETARQASPSAVELLATRSFDAIDTPRRESLPLATELAQALGVPLRVTESL